MITIETPWRTIGNCSYQTWYEWLQGANSAVELRERDCYDAAFPHTIMCLWQMSVESRYGTSDLSEALFNPLGLKVRKSYMIARFYSFEDALRDWRDRISDMTYAYKATVSLADYIHVYAPDYDGNDEAGYLARGLEIMNGVSSMQPLLQFGKVPHPPYVSRLIPDVESSAWRDQGKRVLRGTCHHSMVGTLRGTDGWFRRGTETTGMTDYGIGGSSDEELDGVIYKWNDPVGKLSFGVSRNRAPFSNAWGDEGPGIEGAGISFVRAFGVSAVNRDLCSIELSDGGNVYQPISPKQWASSVALTAYMADYMHIPYYDYPTNPATEMTSAYIHSHFSKKLCPWSRFTSRISEHENAVRAILKRYQLVTSEPHPFLPNDLIDAFSTLRRIEKGEPQMRFKYDPDGPISRAWLARGIEMGLSSAFALPEASLWLVLPGSFDVVIFDDVGIGPWVGLLDKGTFVVTWVT